MGSITGIILIEYEDFKFPEDRWSDFPVVICDWWCIELMQLMDGETNRARLQFMDGEFHVELENEPNRFCHISFIDDRGSGRCVHEGDCSVYDIANAIAHAGSQLLAGCERNEWEDSDITSLRRVVGEMMQ